MSHEEMSFCELRNKEIVNETDGRRLGKTCDLIFSPRNGYILGIVAPFNKRGLFLKGQEVFIPFKHISKIGPDVILVKLTPELSQETGCVNMGKNERSGKFEARRAAARSGRGDNFDRNEEFDAPRENRHERNTRENYGEYYEGENDNITARQGAFEEGASMPDCDFRCEKCMLFDCNKRWKGNTRQRKHRPPQDSGSAYVDGKLYEANEK